VTFWPKRVVFERSSLNYPLGEKLWQLFREKGIEVSLATAHNRVTSIPGQTLKEAYLEAKKTLVVGVRRQLKFATCRPSAHYQLPLVTSCPGRCEYCYLFTNLGKKPYIRIYVNIEEILGKAEELIKERKPEITVFEGSATSDPLPVEPYTGILSRAVSFFGSCEYGRFRFVTKFTGVGTLLGLNHGGRTRIRFSVNAPVVTGLYEHATPGLDERLTAARKVAAAGYPLGFLVAPIIVRPGWQEGYRILFEKLSAFNGVPDVTLEFITHRFTPRAKKAILEIHPGTTLEMEENKRTFVFGQFGYGKYVYKKEKFSEIKDFFTELSREFLPAARIEYFV